MCKTVGKASHSCAAKTFHAGNFGDYKILQILIWWTWSVKSLCAVAITCEILEEGIYSYLPRTHLCRPRIGKKKIGNLAEDCLENQCCSYSSLAVRTARKTQRRLKSPSWREKDKKHFEERNSYPLYASKSVNRSLKELRNWEKHQNNFEGSYIIVTWVGKRERGVLRDKKSQYKIVALR